MLISGPGSHAALGSAVKEPQLQKVRLDHIHDGVLFLADRGGDRIQPHRPAVVFFDDRFQDAAVHVIQAERVHLQQVERFPGNLRCDDPICAHLGKIAHAPQEAQGHARRSACPASDLFHAAWLHVDIQ